MFYSPAFTFSSIYPLGFCRVPGFALGCCASFKRFWPLALVQQALPAIILQALRRLRGAVLFRSLRPSSCWGFPCWLLGLTVQSSRPAFGGRLTFGVSQSTGENVFRILLIALLAFGVWKGYEKYQSQRPAQQFQEIDISSGSSRRNRSIDVTPKFQCDGRTHCSQMTSCEEATFFLKNCPGTKMDGNNDGVPCEQQWCK